MFLPCGDKSQQAFSAVLLVSNIRTSATVCVAKPSPTAPLVHPGTMDGGKAEDKAWSLLNPAWTVSPVHPDNIAPHVPRRDGGGNVPIQMREKGDACHLPLALCRGAQTVPVRVSKPAHRFQAPVRAYVCSPPGHPGWAARVCACACGVADGFFRRRPPPLPPRPAGAWRGRHLRHLRGKRGLPWPRGDNHRC